jgi:hypothetical protein
MASDRADDRRQLARSPSTLLIKVKRATTREDRQPRRRIEKVAGRCRPSKRIQRQRSDDDASAIRHYPGREAIQAGGGIFESGGKHVGLLGRISASSPHWRRKWCDGSHGGSAISVRSVHCRVLRAALTVDG